MKVIFGKSLVIFLSGVAALFINSAVFFYCDNNIISLLISFSSIAFLFYNLTQLSLTTFCHKFVTESNSINISFELFYLLTKIRFLIGLVLSLSFVTYAWIKFDNLGLLFSIPFVFLILSGSLNFVWLNQLDYENQIDVYFYLISFGITMSILIIVIFGLEKHSLYASYGLSLSMVSMPIISSVLSFASSKRLLSQDSISVLKFRDILELGIPSLLSQGLIIISNTFGSVYATHYFRLELVASYSIIERYANIIATAMLSLLTNIHPYMVKRNISIENSYYNFIVKLCGLFLIIDIVVNTYFYSTSFYHQFLGECIDSLAISAISIFSIWLPISFFQQISQYYASVRLGAIISLKICALSAAIGLLASLFFVSFDLQLWPLGMVCSQIAAVLTLYYYQRKYAN